MRLGRISKFVVSFKTLGVVITDTVHDQIIHLLVAIAMPRRSRIQPTNARLATSVQKAASGLASKLNATYTVKKVESHKSIKFIHVSLSKK